MLVEEGKARGQKEDLQERQSHHQKGLIQMQQDRSYHLSNCPDKDSETGLVVIFNAEAKPEDKLLDQVYSMQRPNQKTNCA
jgi:hypothetical protein